MGSFGNENANDSWLIRFQSGGWLSEQPSMPGSGVQIPIGAWACWDFDPSNNFSSSINDI